MASSIARMAPARTDRWADAVDFGFHLRRRGGRGIVNKTLQLFEPLGDRRVDQMCLALALSAWAVSLALAACFDLQGPPTSDGELPVLDVARRGTIIASLLSNHAESCEYFVPIHWLQTVPLEKVVQEIGMFGNQNTVMQTNHTQMALHCRAAERSRFSAFQTQETPKHGTASEGVQRPLRSHFSPPLSCFGQ